MEVTRVLLRPDQPVIGVRSAIDPSGLPPGIVPWAENLRGRGRVLQVRQGIKRVLGAGPVVGASFRGAWCGELNGTQQAFAAFRVSGETRVFRLNLGGPRWGAEITGPGTRFAGDGDVSFMVQRDRRSGMSPLEDLLVIQNGMDAPRVFDTYGGVFSTYASVTLSVTPPPPNPASCWSTPGGTTWIRYPSAVFSVLTSGSPHFNSPFSYDAAKFAHSVGSNNQWILTTGASAPDVDDAIAYSWSGALACAFDGLVPSLGPTDFNLSAAGCLMILAKNQGAPWIGQLRIDVRDAAGSYRTLYDPSTGSHVPPVIVPIVEGAPAGEASTDWYLAVFDLAGLTSVPSTAQGIRFVVKSEVPASSSLTIAALVGGGRVSGRARHEVSHIVGGARAESAATVARKRPARFRDFGAPGFANFAMPESAAVKYQYKLLFADLSSSIASHALFYRADLGEVEPLLLGTNGFYEFDSSVASTLQVKKDNTPPEERLPDWISPGDLCQGTPIGSCLATSGNRLWVGGVNGSELWISDESSLRFRALPVSDSDGVVHESSGTRLLITGERITALAKLASGFGAAPMAVFTNENVYRVEGTSVLSLSRASLLSPHGCMHPRTIAFNRGLLVYLDSERWVRTIANGSAGPALSHPRIEDRLQAADPTKAVAYCFGDQYSLAYRIDADGVGNRRVLNWMAESGEWWPDFYSSPSVNLAGFLRLPTALGNRLWVVSDAGLIFELEEAATTLDDGLAIPFSLQTRDAVLDGWRTLEVYDVGAMCDPMVGASLSVSVSSRWEGTVATGTIHLTGTTPDLYRWASAAGNRIGIEAPEVQCTVSGTAESGWTLRALVLRVEAGPEDRAAR